MVYIRQHIGHVVGVVSWFTENLGKSHWEIVKWILRYLRGTIKICLYLKKWELKVQGYVDPDFGGEVDHQKSIISYIFTVSTLAVS